MPNIRDIINNYLGILFKVGLVIVLLASFFLFSNLTSEFYDTPKFIALLVFTLFMLVLLTLKFTVANKVVFIRTPLDIPLLLLLVVAVVSTILSPAPYVSLLGNQLRVSTSLVALITYALFYFILTNSLKSFRDIRNLLNFILAGGTILSLLSLLSFFGINFLPKIWTGASGLNFTPTGSSFSETAILALMVPILVSRILASTNLTFKIINAFLLTLFGVTIALTGVWATWIAGLLGLILAFLITNPKLEISRINPISLFALLAPVIIVGLVVILSFVPPLGRATNPIYAQSRNFPKQLQLPFQTSWKISVSAFRDSPFWGSGPSTYLFDFTTYKPIEFNSQKFWNIRFDSAFNEYLQILATLGGIGFLALISLTAMFVSSAWKDLVPNPSEVNLFRSGLAVSAVGFFVILALHPLSLVFWVVGLTILASYFVVNLLTNPTTSTINLQEAGIKKVFLKILSKTYSTQSLSETIRVETLPSILLTISLALTLFTLFFGGKFVLADYHHRQALNAVSQNNGILAYNELIAAEKLNQVNDLYHTDLAQINFALANAIAQAKAPTEGSPSGSLTDQDKQNIQVLLQQSINEGRTATTLSPKSSVNWEILALLYRQIAGVAQNALLFSLDSYGRAIFQDPLNPSLRLNVGGTYYAIKNYDLAIRFFTDSINLKPDFANGYYNLSVALRDKGDLNSALQMAEKVVTLVEKDSADYKVATDYLTDLKNKISPPTPPQPPAAETSGELQNQKLPKVVNVGNPPEKIATPEAIKKPSPSPTPTP